MQVHIHKALVGEETPQAALDQAAKEINELLKK
jgi:ABC-type glycerol-3-phosphate transport system substrate-binding protein